VAGAARARLVERATNADVAELAGCLEVALVADLPEAIPDLLAALDARASQSSDVRVLMDATEPLARMLRYGDVRGTRVDTLLPPFKAILARAIVGLVPASKGLDDDAAGVLLASIQRAHAACLLLDDSAIREDWLSALRTLLDAGTAHPRLRGRACRLLLEQHRLSRDELESRTSLALSRAVEPAAAARWLEELVAGDGLFLIHHEELISMLDAWLAGLDRDAFQAELPLLRRAFSGFAAAERRALGQKLKKRQGASRTPSAVGPDYDADRAARVLPVLSTILGVDS
jgi:hypothetical protein